MLVRFLRFFGCLYKFATIEGDARGLEPQFGGFGHDLSAAEKEHAARTKCFVESPIQAILYLLCKVDDDVAADDEIEPTLEGICQ
jgi:hypothetical protein